ncbi:hypothetical protein BC938DRAFT_475475 [Jimgerdemannia flammicorona]|uniref:Uncharacterized protein n=1 Tax=Jimgerdemannia flammicorona TaxID=994334 RepID=A0A433QRL8_9FUNG|nr:hypothetical protein BC938DRAFT_475475 [Jimgerdemannia flammicorona]
MRGIYLSGESRFRVTQCAKLRMQRTCGDRLLANQRDMLLANQRGDGLLANQRGDGLLANQRGDGLLANQRGEKSICGRCADRHGRN